MATTHMPSVNSREAPRFSDDVTGFDSFFDEVEELAGPARANLSEADKIKWAVRYAGSEAESWKCLECYGKAATTFATFRTQVLTCYPQLSADRRYTHSNLTRLLDRFSDLQDMDKSDLGKYLRKFLSITSYLINESRLLDRERDAAFLRGFPQPIRNCILARLSIKKPDVIPGDGYTFTDVQAAALFVLEAGGITPPQANVQAQVPIMKSEPAEQGSVGELIQAMSSLTRVFTANAQSQQYALANHVHLVQHSLLREEYLKTPPPGGIAPLISTQTPLRGTVCFVAVMSTLSESVLLQPNISREDKSCMMNIRSLRFPMADILLCTSVDET